MEEELTKSALPVANYTGFDSLTCYNKKTETKIKLESLDDIYSHEGALVKTLQCYLGRHRRNRRASSTA
jgi:hypothetical protein